jgi:hypothetical protein
MRIVNPVRVRAASAVVPAAMGLLLAACAMTPASKTYTQILTASANPIDVQSGRLTVIVLDYVDGGPLMRATVDIVAADATVKEPHYYRRTATSDRNGTVTFANVPRLVNVSIVHSRGAYARDNYVVPQTGPSEFRVYIDTSAPRARDECLGYLLCQ